MQPSVWTRFPTTAPRWRSCGPRSATTLYEHGLLVFEPDEDPATSESSARLMVTAEWADEKKTSLAPVDPQPSQVVVDLETGAGGLPKD
ncbi:MAG: hypothetical protein ACPGQM_08300 [Alphaproteobacteria bacterium]